MDWRLCSCANEVIWNLPFGIWQSHPILSYLPRRPPHSINVANGQGRKMVTWLSERFWKGCENYIALTDRKIWWSRSKIRSPAEKWTSSVQRSYWPWIYDLQRSSHKIRSWSMTATFFLKKLAWKLIYCFSIVVRGRENIILIEIIYLLSTPFTISITFYFESTSMPIHKIWSL